MSQGLVNSDPITIRGNQWLSFKEKSLVICNQWLSYIGESSIMSSNRQCKYKLWIVHVSIDFVQYKKLVKFLHCLFTNPKTKKKVQHRLVIQMSHQWSMKLVDFCWDLIESVKNVFFNIPFVALWSMSTRNL